MSRTLPKQMQAVRACRACETHLPLGPRPVLQAIPMGLCYPGRGTGGDLPPRPECAPPWMAALLAKRSRVELTLLIGLHAQRHFLGSGRQRTLTETVRRWQDHAPKLMPLPHPSPRNTPWFQAHPWIEHDLLPALRCRVRQLVAG